jgi:hypothetical protein
VIATGPWSILAVRRLPLPPVFGLKGQNMVFKTGSANPPEALFLGHAEPGGAVHSPEVFPRADGTTYVCAISSDSPLSVDPSLVVPDNGAIDADHVCAASQWTRNRSLPQLGTPAAPQRASGLHLGRRAGRSDLPVDRNVRRSPSWP